MSQKTLELLKKPFEAKDIEWRIQQSGIDKNGKPWAMVLAYVTNRAIMDRLDSVFGIDGWKNEFKPTPNMGGTLCGLSFKSDGEWVTKWDGAEDTQVEATKGGLSSSMKRAAVQLGIGRYLYHLETGWANVVDKKAEGTLQGVAVGKDKKKVYFQWLPPELPPFALPIMKSQIKIIKETATKKGVLISDIESGMGYTNIQNMTKQDGLEIIQNLGKKKDLNEKELEKFKKELENEND